MNPELKPCPFCGSRAAYRSSISTDIGCSNTGCIMYDQRTYASRENAVDAWNTRVMDCQIIDNSFQIIEKLKELLESAQQTPMAPDGVMHVWADDVRDLVLEFSDDREIDDA